jgi:hypothetical protein
MGVWYCTEEDITSSLEIAHTARAKKIIASCIGAGALSVEGQLHRRFYPELKTVTFDWPNYQYAGTNKLYLGDNELISVTSFSSGGTAISASDYFLRRSDNKDEPPYTYIEIDSSSSSALSAGDTSQRAISITGLFGFRNDWTLDVADLAGDINTTVTTVDLKPLDNKLDVGIGSLIRIGDEKMFVDNRRSLDTTQNIGGDLAQRKGTDSVLVSDGTGFALGEIIIVGSERMRVDDITGNTLQVTRAFDGTTLGAHTTGADIYALRRFTVRRGVLGSTAVSHTTNDDVDDFLYPGLVKELNVAEAIVFLQQRGAGYARVVGSGENQREAAGLGLNDLRALTYQELGRKARLRAI